MKSIFFIAVSLLFCFLLSCKKETSTIIKDPCENAHELRSKPYANLYKGKLPVCLIENKYIYPEKNEYGGSCINPNNEYEICYINNSSLYKYNFCTNEINLVMKNISYNVDWSIKNWITFVTGDGLWKIKPNGDSLIKLNTPFFTFARWSPSGTKLFNGRKILDENGEILGDIPLFPIYNFTWETDTTFLCVRGDNSNQNLEIFRYNLNNKTSQVIHTEVNITNASISFYSPKYASLFIYVNEKGKNKYIKFDTKTWKSVVLGIYEQSYTPRFKSLLKDKLLVDLALTDTSTGKPCSVNYRQHIALMNLDCTNERQVMLPE